MLAVVAVSLLLTVPGPGARAAEPPEGGAAAGATGPTGSGAPAPLRVGEVRLRVRDIYTPEEIAASTGLLRFVRRTMNAVHSGTRRYVLRRELLFRTGDPLDPELLAETERNLRELGFLRRVRVVPVDTLADGRVDVEVRAQEVWSLQTEFAISRASEGSLRWSLFFSDDNFLGHGLQVGFGLGENEDYRFTQVNFRQRRLLGSRWRLGFSAADLGDGHAEVITLDHPFYAQDDPFALELQVWRDRADRRWYLSNAGPAGGDPAREFSLYTQLETATEGVQVAAMVRVSPRGEGRIWRLGAGAELRDLDYRLDEPLLELSDDRFVPREVLLQGDGPLRREEGTLLYPFLQLETRGRTWTTTSFLLKYGPVEDVPLDPSLTLRAGPAGFPGGSDTGTRLQLDYLFRDWSRLGRGFLLLQSGGLAATLGERDENTAALWGVAGWIARHGGERHPRQTRLFAEAAWGDNLLGSDAFVLGLNRGLRTLAFDGMAGDRLLRWNAEHGLVLPVELLGFYRVGLAAFYDGGLAWWHDEDRGSGDVRHEVGCGLRLGSTRSARGEVARLDLTWAPGGDDGLVVTAVTRGLF